LHLCDSQAEVLGRTRVAVDHRRIGTVHDDTDLQGVERCGLEGNI